VNRLPNIKSAKKRVLVSEKKAETNKAFVTSVKTTAKKFDQALAGGNKEEIAVAHKNAVKKIDTAVSKGFLHKNAAARKKSQMDKKVNACN
jgi:small subunit ribosomal protein S20